MATPRKPSKPKTHEAKGDALAARGKHSKALTEYRKAIADDPKNAAIYNKLIRTRDQMPGEWDAEDFAESVGWAMKKQEQEHPPIKQAHARLTPEWTKAIEAALGILYEVDEKKRQAQIEELVAMGEVATRAMIGLLLDLKNAPKQQDAGEQGSGNRDQGA